MLRLLPESQRTRNRRLGGTAVSVAVHTGLIALALVATARATATPKRFVEVIPNVIYTSSPIGEEAVSRTVARGAPLIGPIVRLVIPPVSIPTSIPAIDLSRPITSDQGFAEPPTSVGGSILRTDVGPSASSNGLYTIVTVEKPVVPAAGNPAPVYPPALRAASLEGSVVARFVVDTTGIAEVQSISFIEASHSLFADAVRQAILRSHYLPAMVGGRRVRQLVEQRFAFTLQR